MDNVTDEELAEWEEQAGRGYLFNPEITQLIAALRASRGEVDKLKSTLDLIESYIQNILRKSNAL